MEVMDMDSGEQTEFLEAPEVGESAISNLGWTDSEITPDGEMQDSAINNVQKDLDNGDEIEALQDLTFLELIALCNDKERILKNAYVLSVKERGVSQIEGTNKLEELFREISKNAPKSQRGGNS